MAWVIRYRLERERPLDDVERAAVSSHASVYGAGWEQGSYAIEAGRDVPVVVRGTVTLPVDAMHADRRRWLEVLVALRRVVDATLVIEDSVGTTQVGGGVLSDRVVEVLAEEAGAAWARGAGSGGEMMAAAEMEARRRLAGAVEVPAWANVSRDGPIPDVAPPAGSRRGSESGS